MQRAMAKQAEAERERRAVIITADGEKAAAQAVADAPVTAYPPASDLLVAGDGEAATLARIDHELAALEPLIREAERQSSRDARVRFEYGWLRADLGRMRQGIKAHLEAPRREPRRVEPLRGEYRT